MDDVLFDTPNLILNPTLPETNLFFCAARSQSIGYVRAVDRFLRDIKRMANFWQLVDVCYIFCAPDQQSAFLNVKKPGSNTCTVGAATVTFTPWSGIVTDGTSGYVDTNWNFTQAGNNFSQDTGSIWLWHGSNTSNPAGSPYGWFDGTDGVTMNPKSSTGFPAFRINQAAQSQATATTVKFPGVYEVHRVNATATGHQNYSGDMTIDLTSMDQNTNPNQTSVAVNNATFNIGRNGAASFGVANIKFLMAGAMHPTFSRAPMVAIQRLVRTLTSIT